ncbi:KAP family P-loop NTPase fold protein [Nitrincola sp. MINF-07-Sa-05]|uniref:KAP family P-loop NTPase fold protein n=1 Tax=Nitrincola salilacus TaxID=3400273 RepID=UPI0039182A7E
MSKKEKIINFKADSPIDVDKVNPFSNDLLEFESAIKKLSSILPHLSTPFTVGIYGDWGSGKTSFMRLLSASLENNDCKNTFWFNAWEYENDTSLMLPLLSKLSKDFKTQDETFDKIKKIAASVVLTGADIITKVVTLNTTSINDIGANIKLYEEQVGESYERWVSDIDSLKSSFKDLIHDITKGESTFYIFIDDLDRCLPENIIKLIENIKHFLSVAGCNCVFILGIDKTALTSAIKARYGTEVITGDDYLEKIINIAFNVPTKNNTMSKNYIRNKLKDQIDQNWFNEIENDVNIFSDALSETKIKNPRKLKILISRYLLFMAFNENKDYFIEIIVSLLIYREFFPDAYNIKKKEMMVDYFPSTTTSSGTTGFGRTLSFSEIEIISCRGFAVIHHDERYKSLRYFTGVFGWLIHNCFDKSDAEIDASLRNTMSNPPQGDNLKLVKSLIESSCTKSHKDYFDAVDFIFSLS